MRWVTNYLKKLSIPAARVAAGGWHNLVLTGSSGQVIAWGGGDHGQLGNGFLWDDPRPRLIVGLKDVIRISAGRRHNVVLRKGKENLKAEVWAWGFNG